jgi:hypothetical protein
MSNKQTAVEWLFNEYINKGHITIEAIEQALEMEKEQIIDAFGVGCQVESTRLIGYHEMAEQYYKETYEQQ